MRFIHCQIGYRALPHWFAQFRRVWGYWTRSNGQIYFAKPHLTPPGYASIQKLHAYWMYSPDLEIYSHVVSHLTGRSTPTSPPRRCCLPLRHHPVTLIMWPELSNFYFPPNKAFFKATEIVVKDAADTLDCQGLGEQWHYWHFYVRPHGAAYWFSYTCSHFRVFATTYRRLVTCLVV